VTDAIQEPPVEEPTTPAASGIEISFDEPKLAEWERDLHGLLTLGYLCATFEWCGHTIRIKTLNTDEELILSLIVQQWEATIGGAKAYATAICGIAVQSVDGQPMPSPLGDQGDRDRWALERFNYARRWFPWTIDAIYNHYLLLEARVKEVLLNLGKASAPMGAASPGSSGSSDSPSGEGSFTGPLFQ
jgi:hypothetical protein